MRVAIIDELDLDRQKILYKLRRFFSESFMALPLLVDEYESGKKFLREFTPNLYDIIFVNYAMNEIPGIETAREVRKKDLAVELVFIAASPEHAIECYKVRASGYLLKPITYKTIFDTLILLDLKKMKDRQFIEVGSSKKVRKILLSNIIYCDISGHYTQFHTTSGIMRVRMSFTKTAELLSPYEEFFLCYRGCIVNLDHVCRIDRMTFFMINDERIPFRKKEQSYIQKAYFDYLFEKARFQKGLL